MAYPDKNKKQEEARAFGYTPDPNDPNDIYGDKDHKADDDTFNPRGMSQEEARVNGGVPDSAQGSSTISTSPTGSGSPASSGNTAASSASGTGTGSPTGGSGAAAGSGSAAGGTDTDTEGSGYTVSADDLSGSNVDDEISGVHLIPMKDLPDAASAPKVDAYRTYQNMMAPWLLSEEELNKEYGKEETAKRVKQSAQVQGIMRLGQAMHALANLSGTSQGAAYQELPKVNDYPLAAWKKTRDEEQSKQIERNMKARQADYQEWLAAKKTWDDEYKAIQAYNDKAEQFNAKAINDRQNEIDKIANAEEREKQRQEFQKSLIEYRLKLQQKYGRSTRSSGSGSRSSDYSSDGSGVSDKDGNQARKQLLEGVSSPREQQRIGRLSNAAAVAELRKVQGSGSTSTAAGSTQSTAKPAATKKKKLTPYQ